MLLFPPPQDRSLAGKLEPVSPPSPPHADPELELVPPRLSKEELIQNMDRVDREITMVEQQISKLKKKQVRARGGGCSGEENTGDSSERVLGLPTCRLIFLPDGAWARVLFCVVHGWPQSFLQWWECPGSALSTEVATSHV